MYFIVNICAVSDRSISFTLVLDVCILLKILVF